MDYEKFLRIMCEIYLLLQGFSFRNEIDYEVSEIVEAIWFRFSMIIADLTVEVSIESFKWGE